MLTFIGIALRPSRNEDADSSQKPLTPERLFLCPAAKRANGTAK
jgi:hypothetical protein